MKGIIILSLIFFQTTAFSKCYKIAPKDIKIKWTAYKTPLKVGVSGYLDKIWPKGPAKGSSVAEIIKGTTLTIGADGNSVNTKNKARDIKIAKHFFNGRKITAKVVSLDDKKMVIAVNMLGKEVNVPMSSKIDGQTFRASGHLDVLDFGLSNQLKAINKACYAKHEGKTWSDVAIELRADFTSC